MSNANLIIERILVADFLDFRLNEIQSFSFALTCHGINQKYMLQFKQPLIIYL